MSPIIQVQWKSLLQGLQSNIDFNIFLIVTFKKEDFMLFKHTFFTKTIGLLYYIVLKVRVHFTSDITKIKYIYNFLKDIHSREL